jgi:hypothetical protein
MRALTIRKSHTTQQLTDVYAEYIEEDRRFIATCDDYRYRHDPANDVEMLEQIMTEVQQHLRPLTPWMQDRFRPNITLRWDSPRASDRLELRAFACTFGGGVQIGLSTAFHPTRDELVSWGYNLEERLKYRTDFTKELHTWSIKPLLPRDCTDSYKDANPGDLIICGHDYGSLISKHTLFDLDYTHLTLDGAPRYDVSTGRHNPWATPAKRGSFTDSVATITQDYLNLALARS